MSRTFSETPTPLGLVTKRDEIRRIARLARLRLSPAEEDDLTAHLHTMLSYIETLREVNTDDVEPLTHAVESATARHEDRVTNQPNTQALLQNAPARVDHLFVVPRIIE